MKSNIYIIRHGETLLNKLKRNQGWIDSDLTSSGKEFLKQEYLDSELPTMDAIYCSDLGRAVKTLKIILTQLDSSNAENIHYTKKLRERFLGSFEGLDLQENRKYLSEKEGFKSFDELLYETSFSNFINITKKHDPLSLAEDFDEFSKRITEIVHMILNKASKNNHKNVMIVSHANTVKFIIEMLTGKEYTKDIPNGKAIKVIIDNC